MSRSADPKVTGDVSAAPASRPRVDYFYDEAVGNFHYGAGHPMRPHRVRLTHNLIVSYGMYKHLNVFRPKHATYADFTAFHTDEYIDFLKAITPENMTEPVYRQTLDRFNICEDCPVFDGLYEYCQTYTGGSLGGAARLNQGSADVVINWAGGLHHAKKGEASGFCYTNDIVLAILELLKVHPRVLYVDIDIHHGDGVEEAFYLTNRVLTLSFHQSGASFFPRTGHLNDTGGKRGAGYSLNFPLNAGMDDATYKSIFQPVIAKVRRTRAATNPHATLSRAHARCHLTRCVAPSRAAWPHPGLRGPISPHPVIRSPKSPKVQSPSGTTDASPTASRAFCAVSQVFECFAPTAVVMCCGADSLSGDRVGVWNLSIKGHAAVIEFIKTFDVPMLVLGGGGYTIRNVARCWCYETSRLLNVAIDATVPWHDDMDYYLPDYQLHMPVSNMQNDNVKEQLEATKQKLLQQLASLEAVPNVQMKRQPDALVCGDCGDAADDEYDDVRSQPTRRHHLAEFNDEDGDADRLDTDGVMGALGSYEEPPEACRCVGACDCQPPNPFVDQLTNGRGRSYRY